MHHKLKNKNIMQSKIKEVYHNLFPTDEEFVNLNKSVTFGDLLEKIMGNNSKRSIFDNGYYDSIIRERVFEILSKKANISYEIIYQNWLKNGDI